MYLHHGTAVTFVMVLGWLALARCTDQKNANLPESTFDFSKSNDVSVVGWPDDMLARNGIASLGGPRKVVLKLVGGKIISTTVDEVHAEKRGKRIWWIALLSVNGALKDSVAIAKEIISVLGYSSKQMDDWFGEAKKGPVLNYEEVFRGKKYAVTIKILNSFDKAHPWCVKATIYLE